MARALLNTLIFAALSAAVLAARVWLHGETFNERTELVILLGTLAGAITAAILTPLFEGRQSSLWRWRAGAAFAWVFVVSMTALYVLEFEVLARRFEHPADIRLFGMIRYMAQTAGHFLAFCPAYLLPWELPLLSALAAALLPGIKAPKG